VRAGCPVVDVEIRFDNRAEDHRLRIEFPTPVATDEIVSDGPFLIHRRPVDPPAGEGWVQPPPGTVPQHDFSVVEGEGGGLAVFNRGLPEAQAVRGPTGTGIAVTLLRCVGWLSRDDFESRRCQNAGPTLFTPDAQCPGPQCFRLAVMAYAGSWLDADVKGHGERWRVPPVSKQGVLAPSVPGGTGLLESTSPRTSVTAVKRCEDRDTLVVRVVNLAGEPTDETLVLGPTVRRAWRTSLLEERESALAPAGAHEVRIALGAHEIATLELELDA
jgi:alpha-mannosidase